VTHTRRQLLTTSAATLAGGLLARPVHGASTCDPPGERYARLDAAAARPVLDVSALNEPVIIEAVEVLQPAPDKYLVRVRARGGATGLAVGNELQMGFLYPILQQRIAPFLVGKDARQWEQLLEGVYVYASNYKMQGLPFWLPLASVEFAVIDLLGRLANKSAAQLLGGVVRSKVEVYEAFNHREKTADESVELMAESIARTGARAVKFKVGGRMSRNADSLPGRTERLIPLARRVLGDDITLYADSNGSYDVPEAIRIGHLLQAQRVGFFEEPVPFDHFEDTKAVADALDVPIAGGEQDASAYNLRWALAHDALQIVQPDLFYFGGFVRCIRVARMAQALGCDCTPHISGTGLGFLYMLHFAACVPNIGPHQEFKGVDGDVPAVSPTSSLRADGGLVTVPTGPGLGVDVDPAWVAAARVL
jgi:L-alanine-DL-glutamate epimerase-like enolase superfamily enzyme